MVLSNSSDDDGDGRGRKSNTGREHKPEDSKDYEKAPAGHLGMRVIFEPAPGLGLSGGSKKSTDAYKTNNSEQV